MVITDIYRYAHPRKTVSRLAVDIVHGLIMLNMYLTLWASLVSRGGGAAAHRTTATTHQPPRCIVCAVSIVSVCLQCSVSSISVSRPISTICPTSCPAARQPRYQPRQVQIAGGGRGRGRGHSTPRRQRPAPRPLPQGRHRAVVPLLKPPQLRLGAARPWPRPRYRPHPLPATVPSREQRGVPGPDKNRRESAECWIYSFRGGISLLDVINFKIGWNVLWIY